jgi:hypothetical protein
MYDSEILHPLQRVWSITKHQWLYTADEKEKNANENFNKQDCTNFCHSPKQIEKWLEGSVRQL